MIRRTNKKKQSSKECKPLIKKVDIRLELLRKYPTIKLKKAVVTGALQKAINTIGLNPKKSTEKKLIQDICDSVQMFVIFSNFKDPSASKLVLHALKGRVNRVKGKGSFEKFEKAFLSQLKQQSKE